MERGYAPGTRPVCSWLSVFDEDSESRQWQWTVLYKDNFLLDCTPDSRTGYDWAQKIRVEDQCEEVRSSKVAK